MDQKEYLAQFVNAVVNGNEADAKAAHHAYIELKSRELLKEAGDKLRPGYNDPELDWNNDTQSYEKSDDGRQQGMRYEADPQATMKFRVKFYHPDRNNEGGDATYPASNKINAKYAKEFATSRQAEKYLNSPYVLDMLKQYKKANRGNTRSENDISSVNYNPETNLVGYISQINLTQAGNDKANDDAADEMY